MGKLFRIEMKKLWRSTAMRVMVIVSIVLSLISVASYAFIDSMADEFSGGMFGIDGYSALNTLLSDNSDSMLFAVLLIAILIGGDFSARTLQTQISAGFSRMQVIISRFLSTIVAYLVFHVTYMIFFAGGVTIVLGFGKEVTGALVGEILLQMLMSLFMSFAMLAIYMFFCFLLKSTGASIGVCLPFMLVGTSIIQMLSFAFETCEKIIALTPFGQIMLVTSELDGLGYVKFFAVGIVWMVGMLAVTFATFRKAELK